MDDLGMPHTVSGRQETARDMPGHGLFRKPATGGRACKARSKSWEGEEGGKCKVGDVHKHYDVGQ